MLSNSGHVRGLRDRGAARADADEDAPCERVHAHPLLRHRGGDFRYGLRRDRGLPPGGEGLRRGAGAAARSGVYLFVLPVAQRVDGNELLELALGLVRNRHAQASVFE